MTLSIRSQRVPGYERVVFGRDPAAGLDAIIAIHSTALGPSLGGVRMWPYRARSAALRDALRLSAAMSAKAAMAGLALGGGKAVIIGDPRRDKSDALFHAMGGLVDALGGRYLAAEDAGIRPGDLSRMGERTRYVTGRTRAAGGSGAPSGATAQGVIYGMRAALAEALGASDLGGVTVAIKGVGSVGWQLARRLSRLGAYLIVSDISPERERRAVEELGARVARPDRIHAARADLFAPCALGSVLSAQSIRELKVKVVAGAANNQFKDETRDPARLARRGILHAPDFVINAGGLIRLYVKEVAKRGDLRRRLAHIARTLEEIFHAARAEKRPPMQVAQRMAARRIAAARRRRRHK